MISAAEIAKELTENRSKQRVNKLVTRIEKEGIDFKEFFEEVDQQSHPTRWYMTWLLTHFVESNPEIGTEQQVLIWNLLKDCTNQSMLRDLWRCMSHIEVNDDISGEVYERAIKTFSSQKQAIAVRGHSLECACNIAKPYPELRDELTMLMRVLLNDESAGIRSKAKNWIKAFS